MGNHITKLIDGKHFLSSKELSLELDLIMDSEFEPRLFTKVFNILRRCIVSI